MHYSTAVKILAHRDEILKMRSEGVPVKKLVSKFGLHPPVINGILNGDDIYEEAKELISNREEIVKMYKEGASISEIASKFYYSRNRTRAILNEAGIKTNAYRKPSDINRICYQGIYDYFMEHPDESILSFIRKVYSPKSSSEKLRYFLFGEHDAAFTIPVLRRMCRVVGKPFEEAFAPREVKE